MKKIFKSLLTVITLSLALTSCLKSVNSVVNGENLTASFLQIEFPTPTGTTINSGLQYFGGGALLYPATHTSDTANFSVTLNGPVTLSTDLTVTIAPNVGAIADNLAGDGIAYTAMPDSLFKLLTPTVVIKAGTRTAYAKCVFYPSKIRPDKSFMLVLTPSNTSGIIISQNFGKLYLHTIGCPIAGNYRWDFWRWNDIVMPSPQPALGMAVASYPAGNGGSFTGSSVVFSPVNPNSILVPTGYYVQPNFLITFTGATVGSLTAFKAVINPSELSGAYTANGITITTAPIITANAAQTQFLVHHTVFNGSAYRDCFDMYTKQ